MVNRSNITPSIGIPVDVQTAKISTSQLNVPLIKSLPLSDENLSIGEQVASKIAKFLNASNAPIVISDGG